MTRLACFLALVALLSGCPEPRTWQVVGEELGEALMSIEGRSETDVWAVGADQGQGPLVLHFDGAAWTRHETGTRGHLWWVHAFDDGTAMMGGVRGTILEWNGSSFVRHRTPSLARQTVFGVWGASRSDVWAVGAETSGRRGFLWHFDGAEWRDVALPADVPLRASETPGLFKVWGSAADDVWAAGADGLVLHYDGAAWTRLVSDNTETLFTVHGRKGQVLFTGGGTRSALLECDGAHFTDVSPADVGLLQGIAADPTDAEVAWAVGEGGAVFQRSRAGWKRVEAGLSIESLHAVWVDPRGGVWAVGGKVLSALTGGAILHLGPTGTPRYVAPQPPPPPEVVCPAEQVDPVPSGSIARRWNEQILGAIRRDIPRPTVHARNLYHLSAAMYDAWAAYDATARGLFTNERVTAADVDAARTEAISYAAYRVLSHRYDKAVGGPVSSRCFKDFMAKLGFDPSDTSATGDSPRAVGNRIGTAIVEAARNDGSNEANNYADTTNFMAVNAPLPVESPSGPAADIDHWQPLDLAIASTQNGIPVAAGVQKYIGAQWKDVTPFALTRSAPGALYVDPGPAPVLNAALMAEVVEVIRRSSELVVDPGVTIDISPGKYGNNPLGENSGAGHPMNPATGQPYAPQVVPLADFGRVLAETWADGPHSETPPGHWNVIANQVFDHPAFVRRWGGAGAELPRLEWDVRAYLVLNGALHDAAIACWEVKRVFTSSRPITLIRSSAAYGQSSDPTQPSYDARGLPLVPGLIELVTAESSAPGQRHEALRNAIGQVAVKTWRGEPGDTSTVSGISWMRAVEWVPYQRRDFVTPAFPGFISGHSTFSRSAAEVLTRMTGSPFFPGGLGQQTVPAQRGLTFEAGPTTEVTLQWATYFDAADQAGQSRIWGGIHITADDFGGRRVGARVGELAFQKAEALFQ
ncbi:MAG: vanadium-dependent haloperoxidase [Myxococcota bacterium]